MWCILVENGMIWYLIFCFELTWLKYNADVDLLMFDSLWWSEEGENGEVVKFKYTAIVADY